MSRDRYSKRRGNQGWKNKEQSNQNNNQVQKKNTPVFKKAISQEQIREEEEAIKAYKNSTQLVCPYCSKPITDMNSAIAQRNSGVPAHFDCVLAEAAKNEKLEEGDKIAYIGQGRFGIINYPNVHDIKHFTIKKIIDWEDKDKRSEWRDDISDLFSRVR